VPTHSEVETYVSGIRIAGNIQLEDVEMKQATSEILKCAACGASNRVARQPGKTPVCGKCRSPLNKATGKPQTITDANFSSVVETSGMPVLIDMWAAWCGPCRMVAPIIDTLAKELEGRAVIGKMDVDANPQTSARYAVQSIPTLLIFKDGREVDRMVGVQSREAILRRLQPLMK
jgi:thioredoxin